MPMLPSRGRPGVAMIMEVERELTGEDIQRLALDPTIGRIAPPIVQRLRDRHHAIARLLASGRTVTQTALACGVTPQRVSDLERTDPAFQQLVADYRLQVNDSMIDEAQEFHGKLVDIQRGALGEIQDRLADDGLRTKMSIEELRKLSEMGLDRTTNPPKTAQPTSITPHKITFNMGPRKLTPKVIEGESTEIEFEEIEGE